MTVATTCARHSRRDRVAACTSCEADLCRDCVVHTAVGIKCRRCTGEKAGGTSRVGGTGRPRWVLPGAAAAVVAVAGAVVLARTGGGGDDDEAPVVSQAAADAYPVEREVEWRGGSGTMIGATLTLPAGGRAPLAAVLIVPGFGAIDRDSVMSTSTPDGAADRLSQDLNPSRPGVPDKLFEDVSDVLARAGMATVRYDKRGSARSQLRAGQALSYDDLVADAKAGLDFLGQRTETAAVPKVVLGHDQGGLVALRLAREPAVRAAVLLSTFGRPLADVVGDDFIAARGDVGRQVSEQIHAVAAELAAGRPLPKPEDVSGHLRPLLPAAHEGYLRAIFGLDPAAEARGIRIPVLLVRGERDPTVTAVDGDLLRAALGGTEPEVVVAGGDHNLLSPGGGRRDEQSLGPVAAWIATHAGR